MPPAGGEYGSASKVPDRVSAVVHPSAACGVWGVFGATARPQAPAATAVRGSRLLSASSASLAISVLAPLGVPLRLGFRCSGSSSRQRRWRRHVRVTSERQWPLPFRPEPRDELLDVFLLVSEVQREALASSVSSTRPCGTTIRSSRSWPGRRRPGLVRPLRFPAGCTGCRSTLPPLRRRPRGAGSQAPRVRSAARFRPPPCGRLRDAPARMVPPPKAHGLLGLVVLPQLAQCPPDIRPAADPAVGLSASGAAFQRITPVVSNRPPARPALRHASVSPLRLLAREPAGGPDATIVLGWVGRRRSPARFGGRDRNGREPRPPCL